jgi:hypothetical protein
MPSETFFPNMYAAFAVVFALLSLVQYKSYVVARRTTGVDPIVSLLAMIVLTCVGRCLLNACAGALPLAPSVDVAVVAVEGNWWRELGEWMCFLADYLLSILWIMLAQGWSIINGVTVSNVSYGIAAVYFCVTSITFLGSHLYTSAAVAAATATSYQARCHHVYLLSRLLAGCWCAYVSWTTYSEYDKKLGGFFGDAIRVLCTIQWLGLVWFLAVPVVAVLNALIFAHGAAASSLARLLCTSLAVNAVGLSALSFLLWPSRMHQFRSINVIRVI